MDGGEKKLWIIANWKANKTAKDIFAWLEEVGPQIPQNENLEVILASPYSLLAQIQWFANDKGFKIKVSSQDVSRFGVGAYTGEEPAEILKGVIEYAIVGHSERRSKFGDTEEIIEEKIKMLSASSIKPILCVPDEKAKIFEGVEIVAYEPPSAIGEGNVADTPEDADTVAKMIKEKNSFVSVLYGGSVNSDNANSFTSQPNINGLLIGRASLDASEFIKIIKACI